MLLAIDIGNTQIVFGEFSAERMRGNWRLTTLPQRTADECYTQVLAFCGTYDISPETLTEVAISSVVPAMTASFLRMVKDRMPQVSEPFVLAPQDYPFIKIMYDTPKAVGADRICNAVAGFARFGGPLIIVDFGTATTFDVVNARGDYLGGIIAPGIETSTAELHRRAAKLFKVDLKFPPSVIGTSTETSMQSGTMFGELEKIEGLVRRIWEEMGQEGKVIATGGLAPLLAERSAVISEVIPFLVLEGLNRIYHQMRQR